MGSKASISTMDVRNPDQTLIDSTLSKFISQYLPGYVPGQAYTGELSAPMTDFENQGMGFLQQYLTESANPASKKLLNTAANELTSTMEGGYDPATSPFFKATRDAAMIEQQDARNKMNQSLGSRNKYFSSEALNEEQQLGTRTTNFLNTTLANMAEKERQNKLTAAGMTPSIQAAIDKQNVAPIAAATTFGSVPREVEQADLERQYQAFLNQRTEQGNVLSAASGAYSNQPMKTVATSAKPGFDWGSFLGMAAGAVVGNALVPGAGLMAGAALGSSLGGAASK